MYMQATPSVMRGWCVFISLTSKDMAGWWNEIACQCATHANATVRLASVHGLYRG